MMSRKELAAALELSPSSITALAKRGMPTNSIEAAMDWRAQHLNPCMVKGVRPDVRAVPAAMQCGPDVAPAAVDYADAALRDLAELVTVAEAALKVGRFNVIEPAMRAALRSVPATHRAHAVLPLPLWDALVQPVAELIEAIDDEAPSAADAGGMTDAEADEMGGFWYAVAAGELRLALEQVTAAPAA